MPARFEPTEMDPRLRREWEDYLYLNARANLEYAHRSEPAADEPPVTVLNFHRRDDLLDDWVQLRAGGCSVVTAAARLGMKPDSLYRALLRAHRAGDPRAYTTVADCGGILTERVT